MNYSRKALSHLIFSNGSQTYDRENIHSTVAHKRQDFEHLPLKRKGTQITDFGVEKKSIQNKNKQTNKNNKKTN